MTDKHPVAGNDETGAVIVAAGESRRMGGSDKMLTLLAKKPLILQTLSPFLDCEHIDRIVVAVSRRNIDAVQELLAAPTWEKEVTVCLGGRRRQDSVLAGVKKLGGCDWVVIHDGARPLVTVGMIERGLDAARDTGAAIAAVPAADTIKLADADRFVRWTPQREGLYICQTPQVFHYDLLLNAFQYNEQDVTDEAQLVELTGGRVRIFAGAYDNIKITTPTDLAVAEALLKRRRKRKK